MLSFYYGLEKAKILKEGDRKIDLEIVAQMLEDGLAIDTKGHSIKKHQIVFILIYNNYPIKVPCVPMDEEDCYFIKSAFPDRRLLKEYREYLGEEVEKNEQQGI